MGLLVAVAAVEIFGQGYVVAGVVIGLLLVLLPLVGLGVGARLGAATSLLVTMAPGPDVLDTAFARGANVPLGCVVAIGIGVLLWPGRADRQLEERLRADVGEASATIVSSLRAIADGEAPRANSVTPAGRAERAALLRDALREHLPAHAGQQTSSLEQRVRIVDELVGEALELWSIASGTGEDRAPELVADELRALADKVVVVEHAYRAQELTAFASARADVDRAFLCLRSTFEDHRAARRTTAYETEELVRLLAVLRQVEIVVRLYADLEA